MKQSKLSIIIRGLIKENPVLVLVLGTCPTLAISTSVSAAIGMGLAATAVLICSNVAISALRKTIPEQVRIPCYIVLIAGFVSVSLIVVNCTILGRAAMFASKNTVLDSALDGIGMGLGFTLALTAMAIIREVFGSGSILGYPIPWLTDNPISILSMAPGGFCIFGCMIALVNKLTHGNRKAKSGCAACPAASACQGKECEGK